MSYLGKRDRFEESNAYGPPQKRLPNFSGNSNNFGSNEASRIGSNARMESPYSKPAHQRFDGFSMDNMQTRNVEEGPSNVLVFNVQNPKYPITVEVMNTICTNSGAIVKRIVIHRKNGVQVMVEFESMEMADTVKESLNGADIYSGCCTLSITYGKPGKLLVTKNDQDMWDYSGPIGNNDVIKSQGLLPNPNLQGEAFGLGVGGQGEFDPGFKERHHDPYNGRSAPPSDSYNGRSVPPNDQYAPKPLMPGLSGQRGGGSRFAEPTRGPYPPESARGPYQDPQRGQFPDARPPYHESRGAFPEQRGPYPDSRAAYPDGRGSYGEPRGQYGEQPRGGYADGRGPYPEPNRGYNEPMREPYPDQRGFSDTSRGGFPDSGRGGGFQDPRPPYGGGGGGGMYPHDGPRMGGPPMQMGPRGPPIQERYGMRGPHPGFVEEMVSSGAPVFQQGAVMMVYGLDDERWNCQKVFNLFCLFGNVVRIKFLKSKDGMAMVQMGDIPSCERAIMFVSGCIILGNKIMVASSKQPFIQDVPNAMELSDGSSSFQDFMASRNNRFSNPEAASKNRIQAPSKVLYFFNCPPAIKEDDLKEVFAKVGVREPDRMRIFPSKGSEKSSTGLCEWEDKGECIDALVLANHTPMTNPSGKSPYILKFSFSDVTIRGNRMQP